MHDDVNSRTCFFLSESEWEVGLRFLFFPKLFFFFSPQNKEILPVVNSSAFELSNCFWVITLRQVECIWYVQYRIMTAVQEGKSSIWQAVNISLWKQNNHLSIVRGSMVRGNLHHKNFTQYRKLLAMRKKKKVCFFSWVLISWCELSVWMFLTSVYAKTISWFFILFFSPGETVGSASRVLQSPLQFAFQKRPQSTLCFLIMFKIKNDKDNIHTLLRMGSSPQLFLVFFFFFFALLKGSFPTQFV